MQYVVVNILYFCQFNKIHIKDILKLYTITLQRYINFIQKHKNNVCFYKNWQQLWFQQDFICRKNYSLLGFFEFYFDILNFTDLAILIYRYNVLWSCQATFVAYNVLGRLYTGYSRLDSTTECIYCSCCTGTDHVTFRLEWNI